MSLRSAAGSLIAFVSLTVLLPLASPAHAARGSDLDRADAALAAGRAATAESLATVALAPLERARRPDSLALARAWTTIARARLERDGAMDSLTAARAAVAAERTTRQVPAGAPRGADALETAGRARSRLGGKGAETEAAAWLRRAVAWRSAARLDPDTALATTLRRLAALESGKANADSARAHLEQALAIRTRAGAGSWVEAGRIHRELAEQMIFRKQFPAADAHLDSAVAVVERAEGPRSPELVPILQIRARYLSEVDQAPRSIPVMERAYAIGREAWGDDDDRTLLLHGALASRYLLVGDPERGQRELLDVESRLAAKPRPDTLKLASIRYVLAGTYYETGDSARALQWIERSARGYESLGRVRDNLYLYGQEHIAHEFQLHDPARAESVIARAIALDHDRPGNPDAITGTLVGRYCSIRAAAGAYAAVDSAADSLAARYDRLGITRTVAAAHAYQWKYWAQLALGHPDEAFRWARRQSIAQRAIISRTMNGMSERAAFGLEKNRSEPIDWMLGLSESLGGPTTTQAWDELVRWRGLVRHQLALRHLRPQAATDTTLEGLRRDWIESQNALARAQVESRGGADEAARRRAEEARRAYVLAAAGRLSMLPDDSVSIALATGALRPDQALVAYYEVAAGTDTAHLGVLVWRAGAPHQRRLGATAGIADLDAAWDQALQAPGSDGAAAGAAGERAARAAGARVRAAVWDPIARWVGDAREVFVVPAGPVQDLHWPALPMDAGGYWVERGPVVRVLNAERELLEPALSPRAVCSPSAASTTRRAPTAPRRRCWSRPASAPRATTAATACRRASSRCRAPRARCRRSPRRGPRARARRACWVAPRRPRPPSSGWPPATACCTWRRTATCRGTPAAGTAPGHAVSAAWARSRLPPHAPRPGPRPRRPRRRPR